VPSTTRPFLIRISTCAAGGTCASATAAPARRKRAKAASIFFRGFAMMIPFRLVVRRSHFVEDSLWRNDCRGNPALFADAAFVAPAPPMLHCAAGLDTRKQERLIWRVWGWDGVDGPLA